MSIKKILIFLMIIFLCAAGALAYFVMTFDAEHYRPVLEKSLSEKTGARVTVGNVGLTWNKGLNLALRDLQVYDPVQAADSEPLLSVPEISANLSVQPLLKKELEIGAVRVESPRIELFRAPQGEWELRGIDFRKMAGNQGKAAASGMALSFFIEKIDIRKATVRVRDASQDQPLDLFFEQVDISLKDISLLKPMHIAARAALFSEKQNLDLKARLERDRLAGKIFLKDITAEADLQGLDAERMFAALPQLAAAGLEESPAGKMTAVFPSLQLVPFDRSQWNGSMVLEQGSFRLRNISSPFSNLNLEATLWEKGFETQKAAGEFAGGSFDLNLKVETSAAQPRLEFQGQARGFDLKQILLPAGKDQPAFTGVLSADLSGTAAGQDQRELLRTLAAEGSIGVEQGVIENLNLAREAISRLNMIPGLAARLDERLSAEYKERLNEQNTVLEAFTIPVKIQNQITSFPKVSLASRDVLLDGGGWVNFASQLDLRAVLTIDKELSEALIRSVSEFSYLADANGRLQLPIQLSGQLPNVIPLPDLQYVAGKLATRAAAEIFAGLMQKKNPQAPAPAAANGTQTQQPAAGGYQDLLGALLQEALGEKKQ